MARKMPENLTKNAPTIQNRVPMARMMITADRMVTAAAIVVRWRSLNSMAMVVLLGEMVAILRAKGC